MHVAMVPKLGHVIMYFKVRMYFPRIRKEAYNSLSIEALLWLVCTVHVLRLYRSLVMVKHPYTDNTAAN